MEAQTPKLFQYVISYVGSFQLARMFSPQNFHNHDNLLVLENYPFSSSAKLTNLIKERSFFLFLGGVGQSLSSKAESVPNRVEVNCKLSPAGCLHFNGQKISILFKKIRIDNFFSFLRN